MFDGPWLKPTRIQAQLCSFSNNLRSKSNTFPHDSISAATLLKNVACHEWLWEWVLHLQNCVCPNVQD